MQRVISLSLLLLLFTSCRLFKNQEPTVIIQKDTTYINKTFIDTVIFKDSVHIKEKGDTVTIYIEKTRYNERYVYDTVYKNSVDTVVNTITKEVVKKEKYIPWWAKISSVIGFIIISITGITLYCKLKK